jgi:hypothetical protein
MEIFDRVVNKVTGRKVMVFITATVLLVVGALDSQQWMYVAIGTAGFVSVENFAGLIGKYRPAAEPKP